ncbi:MAG: indolepyruvate ferredoxin oxidoreductase, beta subunit [Thermacetogenium sp.]|nr:indolepyruvate ferredoxin oxidoreductase, beta subunit [Thermacetogenium sp.]
MGRDTRRIMFAGVGGQGIILATRVLAEGLIAAGYDVKSSEVHGMAQRGGSVVTQLSFGTKVYSPLVGAGAVDILVSMERLEALRYVHFLKRNGTLLVNLKKIPSLPVLTGSVAYPEDLVDRLKAYPVSLYLVDADREAEKLGNIRVMNIVLLGGLVKLAGLEGVVDWPEVIARSVKPQYREINVRAFEAGKRLV